MARVSLTELRETYCSLFARHMILNAEKGVARLLHRCHAEVFLYGEKQHCSARVNRGQNGYACLTYCSYRD